RIGLSATQKPIDEVARFLVGAGALRADGTADCEIVDIGYARQRDLALELPPTPLEAVMSGDQWTQVYARVAELVWLHKTTLVFVNTRRMAERIARHLGERLGPDHVAAHHGSLAKEHRLAAEQRLKRGELRVLIATASLELGIDIGDVDLVCQVGSPRSIAALLQRVGRSGHHVGGIPKGRLFPTSRDDLIECAALLDCVRRGELDALRIPRAPLDVLAQQIVAEVSSREWSEDELFELVRRAQPYADLERARYDAVLRMLAEGYTTRNGVRGSYLHRDAATRTVRGRRGGKLAAVTSGGTIPDNADYTVLLEPQGHSVGTVNEDFAVESMAGDVFQLGNTSYRILKVDAGKVRVEDAHGAAPSIPFWLGEAPGRSAELSAGVARLRREIERHLSSENPTSGSVTFLGAVPQSRSENSSSPSPASLLKSPMGSDPFLGKGGEARSENGKLVKEKSLRRVAVEQAAAGGNAVEGDRAEEPGTVPFRDSSPTFRDGPDARAGLDCAVAWLDEHLGLDEEAARQIVEYLARSRAALGALPTQDTLVMERFFDESGGMQLVLHAPFGNRINRAWGLALRKRFCRTFNFELQAAATEDAIILSLSTAHSFPLDEVWRYLKSGTAEQILVQALLDAPMFNVRWRWNATTALALPRFAGGRKVAPQLQRMKSDDLLASVFPDQAACLENIVGERELPSHPLVDQTLDDCLHDAMDSEGWLALLRRMEAGEVRLLSRDLPAPSPLAAEILNANPYAFLDDAPLEERRTQAVRSRRWSDPESADDLGALDINAIASVAGEARPQARNSDEVQEALVALAFVTRDEALRQDGWPRWLEALAESGRVTRLRDGQGADFWVPLERLDCMQAAYPQALATPALAIPDSHRGNGDQAWTRDDALVEIVRARLTGFGPQPLSAIAAALAVPENSATIALTRLESEGYVMRGRFTPGTTQEEWCERHLLARIHRYTIRQLRREIEPVEQQDFMRFLFDWQHLSPDTQLQGIDALPQVLAQLEGYEAAAGAWESDLLSLRMRDYSTLWLDEMCRSGKLVWTRIGAPLSAAGGPVRSTPIVLLPRREAARWHALPGETAQPEVSSRAALVLDALRRHGAMFFDELQHEARLLPVELENALGELVSTGLANADSFAGMRAMLLPAAKRASNDKRRRRGAGPTMEEAGRWALVRRPEPQPASAGKPARRPRLDAETLEHVAMTLLRRYGVMFWRLLEREAAWLPSWRELLPVYHRLEARGDIRGGRFVAGFSGEQFALPEAIPLLREVRRRAPDGSLVCISGVDPLNLCGTLLAGDKVPALAGNRVLFRDGLPVATIVAGKISYLIDPGTDRQLLHSHLVGA
ncbi:MAG TPA: helicase-related protein, partial [Telluria sp.]